MANNNVGRPGWYTAEVGGRQFTLPDRYLDPHAIGHGAFGAVIRATDKETGKVVAIKKMHNPFQTATHAKRSYRELKLLMYLNHPDAQIIQLYNVFTPDLDVQNFRSLYFVLSYAQYNLNQIIRPNVPFTEDHIKQIIYSLLTGLKFMHSAGIVHRDLKPSNIGIDQDSNVYILDFGLARILTDDPRTIYVTTRWWRAPEVCINEGQYGQNVDIWAVGCIMAQLVCLQPVFRGNDNLDQLDKIFYLTGTPDKETLLRMGLTQATLQQIQLPNHPGEDYNVRFTLGRAHPHAIARTQLSPEGIKLLRRLLEVDPSQRPSAAQAIADPYFELLHDETDEPITESLVDPHENSNHSIETWKNIVWEMIEEFLPPSWVTGDQ